MNLEIPSIRLRHRSWPVITFIGTQWSPAETKARKWTRMLSFGTVWKLNPGFWSSWLTWRREQHNEGRESGGKGAQKYGRRENVHGRRENVHGKRETLTPLFPPPPPPSSQPSTKPQSPLVIWTFQGFSCSRQVCRSITSSQCLSTKLPANRRLL